MQVTELRAKLSKLQGRKEELIHQKEKAIADLKDCQILGRKFEEAQMIIKAVALQTQQELQHHISAITTMALDTVFPDPYEFVVDFVEKAGKTEAEAFFLKDGERIDPMTGSGGGAIDVAAFSLRVSMWRLAPTRNVIVLDEPFRFLSRDLQPRAAEMMKEISKKMKLQIIMVTHNEDLLEAADKIFIVDQKRGKSFVKVQGEEPKIIKRGRVK